MSEPEPGTNLQKWGSYEVETARKEKQDMNAGGSFMKLKVGKNVVRIMPPQQGQKTPFRVVYQHYINIPGQQAPVVFTCPRMEARRPCKSCARGQALQRSSNKADRSSARDCFPSRRVLCNVIDRSCPEEGPKVLAFGKLIHEDLVGIREDEDTGGDFTHPINGFDIGIERVGTTKTDTKYTVRASRKTRPLHEETKVMEGWLEGMHDLDEKVRLLSDQEIEDKMSGKDSGDNRGSGGNGGSSGGGYEKGSASVGDPVDADFEEEDSSSSGSDDDIPF